MEITPRKNGIHSLAEALRAFKKFHENPDDVYALKDSILRSHHGLETLFKHILYSLNPTLLVDDDIRVKRVLEGYEQWISGENATVLDDLKTVNLESAIERLRRLKVLESPDPREFEAFFDSVRKLTFYRNRLQHFALSANPDVVGRILGNALPRALDLLQTTLSKVAREPPFLGPVSLMEEMKGIFPEAPSVVGLLRTNYDRLIQEGIVFFRGRTFKEQILRLKVTDYGKVGAPPYFPELVSEGFLNINYDRSRLAELAFASGRRRVEGEIPYPYMAKLRVSDPEFTESETVPNQGTAKGSFELDAHITFDRPEGFLILPDAEKETAVLRGLNVTMKIHLDYEAEVLMTAAHYDCRRILNANGQLSVRLTAIPRGYESEEVELIAEYQSDLNEESAPFRFHAFREPDGSLKENHILEWTVNTKENLEFA